MTKLTQLRTWESVHLRRSLNEVLYQRLPAESVSGRLRKLHIFTFRLRFTSPSVGTFPLFVASDTGSDFFCFPEIDIFIRSSPSDITGTETLVPGML